MATEPAEIAEEKRILQTVRENLMRLKTAEPIADHAATLVALRESLSEARLPEDTASIMEQMERTAALMAQQQKSVEGTADPENPYFGRMVLADEGGAKRSILIGKSTFISDRVRIVDWRNAPISRIFYQYGEGDTYEEQLNGRPVEGEVALRRTMTIAGGELRRVATDDHTWVRTADGWLDMRDREARLAGGAGVAIRPDSLGTGHASGRRDKHLPEIASLLDPEQFKLITGNDSGVVVIQGSAGSGKTTVGLHRIAWLAFQAPRVFKPKLMMVVVFSRALTAYISQVLPALGVEGVRVREYGDWAADVRRWHYKSLPERYCDTTPALVIRFKTHTALLRMLDEVGRTHRGQAPRKVFDEVLTNLEWIAGGLSRHAPGAFSEAEVARIHRWCCDRFNERDDGGGRKADPDADEGPSLDREDDTILLRLWQVLRGSLHDDKKEALEYAHLMVDEAQDLSPLELAVLIGATGSRRSVTLAGDVAQKVRENREFPSWTEVLDALRLGHTDISPLQVSYRSTRQIMELAHTILGPLAPAEMATTTREGAPVGHLRFDSRGAAATWLGPALGDLMRREPSASVAVLTVNGTDAVDWYHILERCEVPLLRLVEDQEFAFAPGIEVVDIRSAKGLEFDYVVVVGVDAGPFGLLDHARHLLHVAATRAAHQLWLVSTGVPSPLLPPDLPGLAF